jgi:hypothetical protein
MNYETTQFTLQFSSLILSPLSSLLIWIHGYILRSVFLFAIHANSSLPDAKIVI